jgi:hypothetical protein
MAHRRTARFAGWSEEELESVPEAPRLLLDGEKRAKEAGSVWSLQFLDSHRSFEESAERGSSDSREVGSWVEDADARESGWVRGPGREDGSPSGDLARMTPSRAIASGGLRGTGCGRASRIEPSDLGLRVSIRSRAQGSIAEFSRLRRASGSSALWRVIWDG